MNSRRRGILTVISGFSGSGKGTVTRELVSRYKDNYWLSVSATTRQAREGEAHGVHYFFVSDERFKEMIAQDEFLEYAEFVSHSYGTPRKSVEEHLAAGQDVILEIEQQGAFQVKKAMPEAILIFLVPPSIEELERRLRGRGTETEAQIRARLEQAAVESEYMELFDYLIVNDQVDHCVEDIHHLIRTEGSRTYYMKEKMIDLQEGLQAYRKEA